MGYTENAKDILQAFYMGKIYPAIVCAMMFFSYMTATEVYVNVVNLVLLSIGLFVCDSIRPFIAVLPSYLYQFSMKTSMPTPEGLGALLSGTNLLLYIASFSLLAIALVTFFLRNGLLSRENLTSLPLKFSAIVLSAAFLVNGIFSDRYVFSSTIYGVIQIVTFFGIFYLFYLGLKNDDADGLVGYLSYVLSWVAVLIFADTLYLYITSSGEFITDGILNRGLIIYGWGNCNTAGQCAAAVIPICFLGVIKNRGYWFYILAATLSLASAYLSTSRNALLLGAFAYVVSLLICCFFGARKARTAITAGSIVAVLAVVMLIFKDTTFVILNQYIDRGMDSSGRFELWDYAVMLFKESPIFGKGFFGTYTETYHLEWGFPTMLHSTPLQLLAGTGVVGFVAYYFYRICTFVPFLKNPNIAKTMIGGSLLVILVGSLIDNFVFYIPHMLFYPVALAIVYKMEADGESSKLDYYNYITRW